MNRDEVQQLLDLARRIGSTPRRILVEAARMADGDLTRAEEMLQAIRRKGIRQNVQLDDCASLLLVPVSSFARDNLGSALDALWHVPGQAKE